MVCGMNNKTISTWPEDLAYAVKIYETRCNGLLSRVEQGAWNEIAKSLKKRHKDVTGAFMLGLSVQVVRGIVEAYENVQKIKASNKTRGGEIERYEEIKKLASELARKVSNSDLNHSILYWLDSIPDFGGDGQAVINYRASAPRLVAVLQALSSEAKELEQAPFLPPKKSVKTALARELCACFRKYCGTPMYGTAAVIMRTMLSDPEIDKFFVSNALRNSKKTDG
jgi:hypothetical protein